MDGTKEDAEPNTARYKVCVNPTASVIITPFATTMSEQTFPFLEHMISANAHWAEDIESHEPGYFSKQFKGQAPPVCFRMSFLGPATHYLRFYRSSGSDVLILECPNPLSLVANQAICLCTETLLSKSTILPRRRAPY